MIQILRAYLYKLVAEGRSNPPPDPERHGVRLVSPTDPDRGGPV
jgi:hypothetical protein